MSAMDWGRLDQSLDDIIKRKDGGRARVRRPRPADQAKPRIRPGTKSATAKDPIRNRASVSKRKAPPSGRDTKGRPSIAKVLPTTMFSVKNDRIRASPSTTIREDEPVFIKSPSSGRKARIHPDRGLIVTLRSDAPAPVSETRPRNRSRSRSYSVPRAQKRSERLEVRITNEKAVPSGMSSESMLPAPIVSPSLSMPSIPNSGLLSSSSHFRTPMAVMDLYTSRYARPSLEPYRPPPVMQQFYRSLAESTALGHIPPHYNPMGQHQVPFQQQQQQHQPSANNIIRKPYDN